MRICTRMGGKWRLGLIVGSLLVAVGCNSVDSNSGGASQGVASALPDSSHSDPSNSAAPASSTGSSGGGASSYTTAVLLFNGTGVSTSDWQSTESIVKSQGLSYQLVNSAQLNAMSLDQIASFGVIIVPGGEGGTIASNLTSDTRLKLRQAVRDRGVGYVGFCAGAWVAVGPEAGTDNVASYGFAVAPGNVLPAYYPNGNTSLTAAMVDVSLSNGTHRELVWWGGPSTPEWAHGVIGRYPDGSPAISETFSGKGFVVISGTHPEAPQGWRVTAGNDSDGLDYDIAIEMIRAALTQTPVQAF